MPRRSVLLLLVLFSSYFGYSQTYIISGKVIESVSGNPVPFATVVVSGTTTGANTNFEGIFQLEFSNKPDSLTVSYVGFLSKTKAVPSGQSTEVNFQLEEDIVALETVVVLAGENPAFEILRKVRENKKQNDKNSLEAYQYEAYTKLEVDVNHLTEKFRQRKIITQIQSVLDSIEQIAGEDGLPILPIFLSEAISNYYFKSDPRLTHEEMLRTKISGVGVTDGTTTTQLIGSSFQQYNFYNNWLNIFEKNFASPIGAGWRGNYDYELVDSLYVGEDYCYRMDFWPRRSQDLAFHGTMWITRDELALRQIDASVEKSANLNFIEKLKIQQAYVRTEAGPWLPEKTRVLVDVAELTKQSAGMLAKFYVSIKNIVVNEPKADKYYALPISSDMNVRKKDDAYWAEKRHDPLSQTELNVFDMIDTLKTIPTIKTVTKAMKTMQSGYYRMGKVDIGPYWGMFAQNDIEGNRIGLGARTNFAFSKKWTLSGLVNYGTVDEEWKYQGKVERILLRNPWTIISAEHARDIDPIWFLNDDDFSTAYIGFGRWGDLVRPFRHQETTLTFETSPFKGFTQSIKVKSQSFEALATTEFAYKLEPNNPTSLVSNDYSTTEIVLESRIAKDEIFIIDDNHRFSLGTVKWPVIKVKYTLGLKDALGGDFDYQKLELGIQKKMKMGVLGYSNVDMVGGYIFSQVPYPLLKVQAGNELPVYIDFTYNLLNYFEFSSDQYVELRYRHHFEGFILNRIPLLKKLKWRLIGNVNMIQGGVRQENQGAINELVDDGNGNQVLPFSTFRKSTPYVEVGYGIENILKVFRISAFHRLTYTGQPNTNDFGLKFGFQWVL